MIPNNSILDKDDSRQYILMLQDIITRMATNSSNCKAWTITIVTAMMAMMIAVPALHCLLLLILVPLILFCYLDIYYLSLEKDFRNLQAAYIAKLKSKEDCSSMMFDFNPQVLGVNKNKASFKKALLKSKSTWLMYPILAGVILLCCVCFPAEEEDKVQNLEKPLYEISSKLDSTRLSINRLIETPVCHVKTGRDGK